MAELLLNSNATSVPPDTYRKLFFNFIENCEFEQLTKLVLQTVGQEEYVEFSVDCYDLIDYDPVLGFTLVNNPNLLLPIFEEALYEAQCNIIKHQSFKQKYEGNAYFAKQRCHVRIYSLPSTPELTRETLGLVRSTDIRSLIQVTGTIIRTGTVRMLELWKEYHCMNPKCGYRFKVSADPEQGFMLPQPRVCQSRAVTSSGKPSCTCTNVCTVDGSRELVDFQEIRIQDHVERLAMGTVPRSLNIILEADLVDQFNAGDDVVIVGTILRQWRAITPGARCLVEISLRANSVIALNAGKRIYSMSASVDDTFLVFTNYWRAHNASNRPLTARNAIIRAVCPQLCGMYLVKLALLLTLIGGVAGKEAGGLRKRGQGHLLLVGDPGTGKSQLLRFASLVTPRSVLTTGIGTTGAGLTCTAIRDGSDWCLEAGALVLANDGVCCIDEFSSIKEQDRASIHEAMEQQTISVAKAGLVVKLNTRTTVVAVCNPKGTYDVTADITTNTAIASPLLSRFDLVLVLLDTPEKAWDIKMSTFLLQQAVSEGDSETGKDSRLSHKSSVADAGSNDPLIGDKRWGLTELRDYIQSVKERLTPSISTCAKCLLMRYYRHQRQASERTASRTTVRLLESLMRLGEAHARLMFRNEVLRQDAVVAISLMELSMNSMSVLDANSALHSDFPEDGDAAYTALEKQIMVTMNYTESALRLDMENVDSGQSSVALAEAAVGVSMEEKFPVIDSGAWGQRHKEVAVFGVDGGADVELDAHSASTAGHLGDSPSPSDQSFLPLTKPVTRVVATRSDLGKRLLPSASSYLSDESYRTQSQSAADDTFSMQQKARLQSYDSVTEPQKGSVARMSKEVWDDQVCLPRHNSVTQHSASLEVQPIPLVRSMFIANETSDSMETKPYFSLDQSFTQHSRPTVRLWDGLQGGNILEEDSDDW